MTTIWGSTSAGDIKLKIIFTILIISNRIDYKIYLYMYSFSFMFHQWRKLEFFVSISCTESLMKCPKKHVKGIFFTWWLMHLFLMPQNRRILFSVPFLSENWSRASLKCAILPFSFWKLEKMGHFKKHQKIVLHLD